MLMLTLIDFLGDSLFSALRLAFRFLRQVVRDNTVMKVQLGSHVDTLSGYLGGYFTANDTYGMLFQNNKLLLEHLSTPVVEKVQACLRQCHTSDLSGARFVDLLVMMCTVHGRPLTRCQNMVFEAFLLQNRDLLNEVEHRDGVRIKLKTHTKWIDIRKFDDDETRIFSKQIWDNTEDEKLYRFQMQTFRLLTVLSQGRNRYVSDFLLDNAAEFACSYDDLLAVVFNEDVPDKYRTATAALLAVLYIDREPNDRHPNPDSNPNPDPNRDPNAGQVSLTLTLTLILIVSRM